MLSTRSPTSLLCQMALFLLAMFMTSAASKEIRGAPIQSVTVITARVNELYQVQKLKSKILQGLNMTLESTPAPATRVQEYQPSASILNRRDLPATPAHPHLFPHTVVWSEPVGTENSKNSECLQFKVTNQNTDSDTINRAKLVLRMRLKEKRKKGRFRGKKKKKITKEQNKKSIQNSDRAVKSDEDGTVQRATIKKTNDRQKRVKAPRVKVLVQAIHEKSGRFKRVAVQRVTLNTKFRWVSLPIPVTMITRAISSANHTLILKIKCKRCVKGKVSIDMALPHKRKKKRLTEDETVGANQTLNPNRPYLVIRKAEMSLDPETLSPSRSAREVRSKRLCALDGPGYQKATSC